MDFATTMNSVIVLRSQSSKMNMRFIQPVPETRTSAFSEQHKVVPKPVIDPAASSPHLAYSLER